LRRRHQLGVLQGQQELQRVDVAPAAHVVVADELGLHARRVEGLQHEVEAAPQGLLPVLVAAETRDREQAEARDRCAADAVTDRRQLVAILAIDALVRPLVVVVALLQEQQRFDRGLRRRGEVERCDVRHRERGERSWRGSRCWRRGLLRRRVGRDLRTDHERTAERHEPRDVHGSSWGHGHGTVHASHRQVAVLSRASSTRRVRPRSLRR
jgi:hypothetical protein